MVKEDQIFNVFRDMVNRRDEELCRLLGVSRHPVRPRSQPSSPRIPGLIEMVTVNTPFETTKKDILEELRELMTNPKTNKEEVLNKLGKKLSWQGMAELFYLLMRREGAINEVEKELESWEDYSMEQPHYRIKVVKRPYHGCNSIGKYDVMLIDRNLDDRNGKMIEFKTRLEKTLYVWFLLHPRQQMTIDDLWEEMRDDNKKIMEVAKLIYGDLHKIKGTTATSNKQSFSGQFRKLKSRINTAINDAWESGGRKGRTEWYTIQGTENKNPNFKDSIYHMNLLEDLISFDNQEFFSFRKGTGYPEVQE